ncbi:TadE/TadG family type IV pilus assembly protein [Vibrio salinus]|uniref:TadE/TadG family type IV pilus assembly protein n=1 Tax=Vibrio salinus TaxID=2899784 RepID=UPI001E49F4E9|nr:TadE family protein [Vibrio salinus]MCE0495907.1 pilus assembly protein [Vibrio salinus]
MRSILKKFRQYQQGIVSVETALIFPVLLFILVMFFELARIALIIGVVNLSLERAVQNFRQDDHFYSLGESELSNIVKERIIRYSFDLVSKDNLDLKLNAFSDLGDFSGNQSSESDSDSGNDEETSYAYAPILSLNLTLRQDFITPLPELFDLGASYQHEFQQILGDIVINGDD